VTLRGIVFNSIGSRACASLHASVEPPNVTVDEDAVRLAIEDRLATTLAMINQGAPNVSVATAVQRLAFQLNALATSGTDTVRVAGRALQDTSVAATSAVAPWRTSARNTLMTALTSSLPLSMDLPRAKLLHAQAIASTVSQPAELSGTGASGGLSLIKGLAQAMGQADAHEGVQEAMISALSNLARTDNFPSPPPPPPTPPLPPVVPSPPFTPPFPPLPPPLPPAPDLGWSPPPPQRPSRAVDCYWPLCGRRRLGEEKAEPVWGERASELRAAANAVGFYNADQLLPGDTPLTALSGSGGVAMSVVSDYAARQLDWRLELPARVASGGYRAPMATEGAASDMVLQIGQIPLAQHASTIGLGESTALDVILTAFEKTPQQPPRGLAASYPDPMLASPMAAVLLRSQQDQTASMPFGRRLQQAAGSISATASSGGTEDDASARSAKAVLSEVLLLNQSQGMLVLLPRLADDVERRLAHCSVDADCTGLDTDEVARVSDFQEDGSRRRRRLEGRRIQQASRAVDNRSTSGGAIRGSCVAKRCQCPMPWTGAGCSNRFECVWARSGSSGWSRTGCALQVDATTAETFACNCSVLGSIDVQVVVQQYVAPLITFNTISFDDVSYFGTLGDNYVPFLVVGIVDALFLLLFLTALVRNNERHMRKYDRFYAFWREQHAMRQAARGPVTWRQRTWAQLKAQHKLLRVFFQKYELGEDPLRLHTGAQKATVLYCLILIKLSVSSLLSQGSASSGGRKRSDAEEMGFRVLIGVLAASFSLPATVVLDQLFWKSQRMTNSRKPTDDKIPSEVQLIARAALHSTLRDLDARQVLMQWRMAIEEVRSASSIAHALVAHC
jgi:hypothetical protein